MITIANTPKDAARELARRYNVRLSSESLNSLAMLLHSDRYRHRTFVLKAGEQSNILYFVAKGLIRQYKEIGKDNDDVIQDIVHEGNILFFQQCLLSDTPSSLNVQTLEPTILYGAEYSDLKALADTTPDINQLLYTILEATIKKQNKHLDMLDMHPRERYLAFMEDESEIVRRTPLKYVASYLRMAPETLSRVRNAINRQ